ncbi:unnamed protein product, partial [Symbiodinium sp. KB8]
EKEVVLAAVAEEGIALQFASPELQDDPEVVATAVKQDADALEYVSERLRGSREVVAAAVEQNGAVLRFAAPHLWTDRTLLLAAVQQDGRLLKLGEGTGLSKDKEIVRAAVAQDGDALEFADEEMRADKEAPGTPQLDNQGSAHVESSGSPSRLDGKTWEVSKSPVNVSSLKEFRKSLGFLAWSRLSCWPCPPAAQISSSPPRSCRTIQRWFGPPLSSMAFRFNLLPCGSGRTEIWFWQPFVRMAARSSSPARHSGKNARSFGRQ